uniref:Periplasmic component of the tol biopolymer transport system n=1 Tax=uncultured delta proteobacterium HF0200_39N20 TaxID=710833 RepID=E0XUU1_9DELT|nr:periplasmic component of the tol biopolymer transport system [uncultured delta proteobacterium HF0200_39N20]
MPVKNKNKVNQLISKLRSCLYIVSVIVLLSTGRNALAIDYIEITNPKFIPVKVGVAIGAGTEADEVQNIFKANLDKVLYFQIIPGTKQVFEESDNIVFHVDLELKKNPVQLNSIIWSQGKKEALASKTFELEKDQDIRELGLAVSDWFVENTLQFNGVATSRIAYTAQKTNRRKNIMLSSYDGTVIQRFSYNLGSNNFSSWSFDNKNILYTTFTRSKAQLALQPSIRLRSKILAFPAGSQPLGASWHPDGKSILLTLMKQGNADIYSYNLSDAILESLFNWKSLETSPHMSPDGKKIAFVSDAAYPRRPQIYIHNLATEKTERVTFKGNYNSSPKWSPDSTQLAYERQKKNIFQLYKYNLLTRRHVQLTFGRHDFEKPDWSPNGKQIIFSAKMKKVSKLYYISSFGGRTIRVTKSPPNISETNPVWSK